MTREMPASSDKDYKIKLEQYKEVFQYRAPFQVICQPEFVLHVQDRLHKTVAAALEELLCGEVELHSTLCISLKIKYFHPQPGQYREAFVKHCGHDPALIGPQFTASMCFDTYVKDYHSRQLVVCTMLEDWVSFARPRGRMIVTPDGRGGLMIKSLESFDQEMRLPPEIRIMEEYKRLFGFKPPFPAVCEPRFVTYVERSPSVSVPRVLKDLLGGRVNLVSTQDMRSYVRCYPGRTLVVCTMEDRDHYAMVPGRVVVTPNGSGGIMIDTDPKESLVQHIRWFSQVIKTQEQLFKSLKGAILSERSLNQEESTKLLVVARNGEVNFNCTSPSQAAKKIMEITGSKDVEFELCTDIQDDDPPVKIVLKNRKIPLTSSTANEKGKRKKEADELEKSAKRKKEYFVTTDVPSRVLEEVQVSAACQEAVIRLKSQVANLFRQFLLNQGFCEAFPPELLIASEVGPASVAKSPQFYTQKAICNGLEGVFVVAAVFTRDSSYLDTCLEVEMKIKESYSEVLDIVDTLFVELFAKMNEACQIELDAIGKQHPFKPLEFLPSTLRLTFEEGIQMLKEAGLEVDPLGHLSTESERILSKLVSEKYKTDFYILHRHPLALRPFYTMPCDGAYGKSFDVFIRGEKIISGSQRVHVPELLESRAKDSGIDVKSISEYIDIFRSCAPPHGGFGAGLERVVMLFCGQHTPKITFPT